MTSLVSYYCCFNEFVAFHCCRCLKLCKFEPLHVLLTSRICNNVSYSILLYPHKVNFSWAQINSPVLSFATKRFPAHPRGFLMTLIDLRSWRIFSAHKGTINPSAYHKHSQAMHLEIHGFHWTRGVWFIVILTSASNS